MDLLDLDRAASAAYSTYTRLHANAPEWPDLPDHRKEGWRNVAVAVLSAGAGQAAPLTLRERLALKRMRGAA